MTNEILLLNAELDMLKEAYAVQYDSFMTELDKIIKKWFVTPYNAECTRRWIRTTHVENELDICFEIGFFNEAENRIDFGSDFWMDYSTEKNELRVNYGTCGYHSKADIYQTKRVKLLAHIWDNIEEIESELSSFAKGIIPTVSSHLNRVHDIEFTIHNINQNARKLRESEVDKTICPGYVISYPENTTLSRHQRLFGGTLRITKRTPKFVFTEDENKIEFKFRVTDIISHIVKDYMTIEQGS